MDQFTAWRGSDLTKRVAKIEWAFNRADVSSAEEVLLLINTSPADAARLKMPDPQCARWCTSL